ncbi:unnamed protein product [Rotaria magnacalcarata]|uniref:Uncharacterized protein n=2 Tax=Rotaria magnacalcarata TaxID=392030 RepID=A0A816NYA8_9BILA|nr:unnamed protein product [Rotaria magnacalcarata]CAF4023027.1 unnamed protein product [Rotaria magnacalcarata]
MIKVKKILYLLTKILRIIGLIIFLLTFLFIFPNDSKIQSLGDTSSQSTPVRMKRPATGLLSLYEEALSHREKSSFHPMFHNHYVSLKLNFTSMIKDYLIYLKNTSKKKINHVKITCLKSSKTMKDFHPICHIYLNFGVNIFNSKEVSFTFLSHNSSCSLTLANTSDIISLDIHEMFLTEDKFRFAYQWWSFDREKLFRWSQWPLTTSCLRSYLNRNQSQSSTLLLSFFQCSSVNILIHSTSRELFIREQEAVSYWLDLQYGASIDRKAFERNNLSRKPRRLAPFEIAKNNQVCPQKFQNWILNYQKWHENISLNISNRSMTFEEQFQRIIELDVRFLIYKKSTTGIADRMIHFITTYLVALLTNRLFIFDKNWPEFIDVIQSSLNYQPNTVIPWFAQLNSIKTNLSLTIQNNLTIKAHRFLTERYKQDYDYDKDFPERILIFKGHTGGVIHTIASNSSIYRKFLTIDLEMNTENIFGCLYNSIFTYRLSQLIKRFPSNSLNKQLGHSSQQILQTLLSPRFFPIGIQIRVGDKTMIHANSISHEKINFEKFNNFFTCSQDLIYMNENLFRRTNQIPIIFLLSDDIRIRQTALKRWKLPFECFRLSKNKCPSNNDHLQILANSNPVLHISHTNNSMLAFQLGIFDSFLFSLCEQHIITTKSRFGRFTVFASLKQRNIYSLNIGKQSSCHNQSSPLATVGYLRLGI